MLPISSRPLNKETAVEKYNVCKLNCNYLKLGEVFNGGQSATELVSTSSVAAYGLPPALRGRLDRWLLPCSTAGALLFIDFLAAHQSLDSRLYSQLAGHQSPPAFRASLLTGHLRA
nr:hypothetical protein Itr_chr09CG12370 [Ipomoea trifida]